MRRNPFIRVRRYDQRPEPLFSWAEETPDGGIEFITTSNQFYPRERRMQSWRRWI